jgi:Na+/H+ antiporter NhaA
LFITNLAFQLSHDVILQAKLGILAASLLAGLLGLLILRRTVKKV